MVSAPVSAIAKEFGIEGPVFAVSSACSSSGHAIAQAALLIASGLTDVAIVGGSDAIATPACLAAWDNLRAVSATACRPFSVGRDGMAVGEGAAALVLESADHARARGVPIIAELAGIGMSSDAGHLTQPKKEGALVSMRQACAAAGVTHAENLLISAHGTGTPLNDANEMSAIAEVFGERTPTHHVIATKSAHGHLMGASTALQAVLGLCALKHKLAPPILNFLAPEPECQLSLMTGEARPISSKALLVNSFAFGGLNTSLILKMSAQAS
jgi:nodulation protein E